MSALFVKIFYLVKRNKWLAAGLSFLLLFVFGYYASKIKFEEDITRIIPRSEQGDITTKVFQQLKFSDKITVLIKRTGDGTIDDLTNVASDFLERADTCKQYIKSVQGRVDDAAIEQTFDFVYGNLPLFLNHEDYKRIEPGLSADSIAERVENNYKTLISPTGIVAKNFIVNDPLGLSFMALQKLQAQNVSGEFHLKDGYIVTKDEQSLLLFIDPVLSGSETEQNTDFVAKLNAIKDTLNTAYKARAHLDYYGSSFIAVANAKQIKTDILTTVLISMGVLMLLLVLYFRKIYVPVIIFIPSVFGGLFALMCMYFLRDSISAISLSIGAVLLGVTIDYALHILTHYKNGESIEQLFKDIVKPLIMSSSTTAVAFLCLLFVNSGALQDLGIFASISVIMSAVFSIIIIPHLYEPEQSTVVKRKTILDKMAAYPFEKSKVLIIGSLVLIVLSAFTYRYVSFDDDISKLNYIPNHIKAVEKQLETSTSLTSKSLYLVVHGGSRSEVLEKNSALSAALDDYRKDGRIISFSSLAGLVLSDREQAEKRDEWRRFWTPVRVASVKNELIAAGSKVGFKPETHQRFYALLTDSTGNVSIEDYGVVPAFLTDEFFNEKNGLVTLTTLVKVEDDKRADFVKALSATEKDVVIIDRKQLNETFLGHLKDDFNSLINYSLVAVILILWFFFRRVELVLISLVPIAITGLVTMGLMGLLNIQLNIFSTIVTTLIFGHGIDFTIFMTSALQKEHTYGKNEFTTYRTSILLAVLTTVLAIGALVFAKHPALKSISTLSLLGVFSALIITFVFYPIIFRMCITNRVKKHKSPATLKLFVFSVLSFLYYGLGCILMSLLGNIIKKVYPGSAEKKMLVIRKLMQKFGTSVLYSYPFFSKKIVNRANEDFHKQSVIISNHSSFLDSLSFVMLSPKVMFLVNEWVYNSPIFGRVMKLAGFYPVAEGVEGSVDHLKEKVAQGYSLMIFPEGTRSDDNTIGRFHKGAFYLADHFGLDIIPVYTHGNSDLIPKGDFIIYEGSMTLKVGERISKDDLSFGTSYSERTKKISRFFKEEFIKVRQAYEDENYYEKKLYLAFLYKDADVVKAVKSDFKKNKLAYYAMFFHILPKAKIYHYADDFGQIDLLLSWQHPSRKMVTYIHNEEKRDAAKVNFLVGKRKIFYRDNDAPDMEAADTLLISSQRVFSVIIPDTIQYIYSINNAGKGSIEALSDFKEFVNQNGLTGYKRNV
ncbi:1-acyl-sn-glycerol-3-phosphate acyltransferase [Polluticaenibacter yanchengensis]|uniref:MMPL family transporter n=1 Tax=Polluticaenibacter yanchengensis TaxID=3014562 RepID=A0ABT4UK39_9BACT|nr:MMPL family transporter [Chitinophagaceae bacterium LY-5]